METKNDTTVGIQNYEIEIEGRDTAKFTGTGEEMWKHVCSLMVGVPEGVIPQPRVIEDTNVAQAQPAVTLVPDPEPTPDNTQRSYDDLLAAQVIGFAPAQPYYDRGTPVVSWGVDNARASHREHEAKPTVSDAVEKFCEHIKAENRRDVTVPITTLGMHATGQLGNKLDPWTVEQQALPQLATRLGIEQPRYLNNIWPELRAQNWNQHIATAIGHEKSTCPAAHATRTRLEAIANKNVMCRLRNDDKGNPSLWAALSEKYAAFDVDQIAQALEVGMRNQPDARCEIQYTGTGATMDVMFHSDVKPEHYVAGEFFKAGIRVKTSDSGGGAVNIGLLLWQNLCLNLIFIDVAEFSLASLRHLGDSDKLAAKFAEAVTKGESQLGHFLKQWGYACEENLVNVTSAGLKPDHLRLLDEMPQDTLTETELLTGIFTGLQKTQKVSIVKGDLPGLLAAHARDDSGAVSMAPVTRASIVNAITRHAHEHVGRRDPLKQVELEREAGALLVSGRGGKPTVLPFMPPAVRERVLV